MGVRPSSGAGPPPLPSFMKEKHEGNWSRRELCARRSSWDDVNLKLTLNFMGIGTTKKGGRREGDGRLL